METAKMEYRCAYVSDPVIRWEQIEPNPGIIGLDRGPIGSITTCPRSSEPSYSFKKRG